MNSRTWMLFAALLTAPLAGWAQESAENPPATTTPAFDLHNPDIRNIVRKNAESQYAVVVQVDEQKSRNASLEDIFITEVESVEKPPDVKPAPQKVILPPVVEGLLSAVFETVVDEALDDVLETQDEVWSSCHTRDGVVMLRHDENCPGVPIPGAAPQAR